MRRPILLSPSALLLVILAVSGIWLSSACRSQSSSLDFDAVEIEILRFPHQRHATIVCIDCHALQSVVQANRDSASQSRPGGQGHKSCNAIDCHAAAFRKKPSDLCGLCHENIPKGADNAKSSLVPFPPLYGDQQLPLRFAHNSHLASREMEKRLGFHISCTDCHDSTRKESTRGAMASPDHATCSRCHAAEAQLEGAPTMRNCLGCHDESSSGQSRSRTMIQDDLQFSHQAHHNDRKGNVIACTVCHSNTLRAGAADAGNHSAPGMGVCVDCHNDRDRVPSTKRMARCETCHSTKSAGLGSLAPRSHMPVTEKPQNHTRAFRRDHASDALADSKECAQCHTMLSGNQRNSCDECHQVLRPRDHQITFREYDHGLESITSPDRCTTCHQVDFCVACHQKRPRSHFPSMAFRSGGHAIAASINMRACITCHQPSRDCNGFGCHQGQAF